MLVKYKKIEKRRAERKEEIASKKVETVQILNYVKFVFCYM